MYGGGSGILDVLESHCDNTTPSSSDGDVFSDLKYAHAHNPRFDVGPSQAALLRFTVRHRFGDVEYGVEGLCQKNTDSLRSELTGLLASSTIPFVRFLAKMIVGPIPGSPPPTCDRGSASAATADPPPSSARRLNLAGSFAAQLQNLRKRMERTSMHFICCLKANDGFGLLLPPSMRRFDPVCVRAQLRCAGVSEAVRISKRGYPFRFSHGAFSSAYQAVLTPSDSERGEVRERERLLLLSKYSARRMQGMVDILMSMHKDEIRCALKKNRLLYLIFYSYNYLLVTIR